MPWQPEVKLSQPRLGVILCTQISLNHHQRENYLQHIYVRAVYQIIKEHLLWCNKIKCSPSVAYYEEEMCCRVLVRLANHTNSCEIWQPAVLDRAKGVQKMFQTHKNGWHHTN